MMNGNMVLGFLGWCLGLVLGGFFLGIVGRFCSCFGKGFVVRELGFDHMFSLLAVETGLHFGANEFFEFVGINGDFRRHDFGWLGGWVRTGRFPAFSSH